MTKFPKLIHVVEEAPANGDPYLEVHVDGVQGLEIHGQAVAVYELVRVGTVHIEKSFTDKARRATRRKGRR
jgi:hypothetical protein